MISETGPVRIYVGAHKSEHLAFKVLEHSITRHTKLTVEISCIDNSLLPPPPDDRYLAYTNFSYGRFAIPKLAEYQGRAIYMDSDMIVFRDIAEIWELPFNDAKIMVERMTDQSRGKGRLTAVMVMDCSTLNWAPEQVMAGLGAEYDYDELMSIRPLLDAGDLQDRLPVGWNSLDTMDEETRLLHFTRIKTQPWVYPCHPLGHVWIDELKLMLEDGSISAKTIRNEVASGHARPSLLFELGLESRQAKSEWTAQELLGFDHEVGYEIHAKLIEDTETKRRARLAYERKADPKRYWLRKLLRIWRNFYRHPIKFFKNPEMRF